MTSKALLISVGGSPEPIIFSINSHKPDHIWFFPSIETEKDIEEKILPNIDYKYTRWDKIVTESAEDFNICFKTLHDEIPRLLKKWGNPELIVDYTGGTKNMSAALALALIDKTSHFSYVGGVDRNKGGLGIVLSGNEKMFYSKNPWELLAIDSKKRIASLFNDFRFETACEEVERIIERVNPLEKEMFCALKDIISGYNFWDKFKHNDAYQRIAKGFKVFDVFCKGKNNYLEDFRNCLKNNLSFLEIVRDKVNKNDSKICLEICYDLLSNAKRRADEGKYDDSVARLYRSLEAAAQFHLQQYGIITSKLETEKVPDIQLRDEIRRKCSKDEKGYYKVPFFTAYRILESLKDASGIKFMENFDKGLHLKNVLGIRNNSILAHGFEAVKKETYEKLYISVLQISGFKEDVFPVFPKLDF